MGKILITPNGKIIKTSTSKMAITPPPNYLCFTAVSKNITISMKVTGTPTLGQSFECSHDLDTWEIFIPGTTSITLANSGDKVYFRGDNQTVSESSSVYYQFNIPDRVAVSGNIMSLLDKTCQSTIIEHTYCFYELFAHTMITSAPELTATTLAASCYMNMFYNCSYLATPPSLPAKILAESCYSQMFYVAPLTCAPKLPATTLASNCYYQMFRECELLQVSDTQTAAATYVWQIPSDGTFVNTYEQLNMFKRCAGTRSNSNMPGVAGQSYTYYTQNPPV